MDAATEAVAEFIRQEVGVGESALIDLQAADLVEHLRRRGFAIAYVSLCWCEGMNEGNEHTPGCPELARAS